ncbi:unnamed protein product [Oncorhynchus mykiss]|uniref:FACT complex subunit SSRP1 n=1 Tax=Oncorhynchus mykiss TaxID=8022 RepID=A0A060XUY2_ONCMY|nr:unnamed protein product [Oncorhynchus mykiss]
MGIHLAGAIGVPTIGVPSKPNIDFVSLSLSRWYDIYPSFLHGKTFDYKIPYTTVLRLFLLPHKDQRQMYFWCVLDPPIKQGQTCYHFLILLFSKEEDLSLSLNMTERKWRSVMGGSSVRTCQVPSMRWSAG